MRIHIQFLLSFRICFVFHCVTSKENECIPLLSPFLFSFRRTVLSHPVSNYFDFLVLLKGLCFHILFQTLLTFHKKEMSAFLYSFFIWKDCAFTSLSKLFWHPKKRNECIPLFFFLFFSFLSLFLSWLIHSLALFSEFFFLATGLQPAKASCKDTFFSHSNCVRPPCNLGKK